MVNIKLNDEVIRLKQVIKRTKAIVINHLTRHAKGLTSKRGSDQQKAKNERRANRLVQEIEIIKDLNLDSVAKRALKEDITFEIVNKDTGSLEERALARVVCHKIVKKSVQKIKESFEDHELQSLQEWSFSKHQRPWKNERYVEEIDDNDNCDKDDDRSTEKRNDRSSSCDEADEEENSSDDLNVTRSVDNVSEDSVLEDSSNDGVEGNHDNKNETNNDDDDEEEEEEGEHEDISDDLFIRTSKKRTLSEKGKKAEGPPLSSVKHKHLSIAKADSNVKVSKRNRESLLGDSDNEPEGRHTDSHQKADLPSGPKTPSDFRMHGRMAFKSTFIGSLSAVATKKKQPERKVKQPDRKGMRKESGEPKKDNGRETGQQRNNNKKNMRPMPADDIAKRKPVLNPCRVDLAVKEKRPAVKPKEKKEATKSKTPTTYVHPSWEASKRRRQQESAMVKFCGKKIKFDDD